MNLLLFLLPLVLSLTLANGPVAANAGSEPAVRDRVAASVADVNTQVTEGVVNSPPAELWKVWSTAEGYKQLGAAKCDIDFRVGGLIRSAYNPSAKLGDASTIQSQIMAYEVGRMIAFRIHQPPLGFPFPNAWKSMWSVATITDIGNGTSLLRIAGMGYDSTAESQHMRAFFTSANAQVLKLLQSRYAPAARPDADTGTPAMSLDPIEKTVLIRLAREQVWNLFATREGWKRVIAQDADIELKPGGKFEIHFDTSAPKGEQGSEGCKVLSVVPGEMLSYSWNAPPKLPFARTQHTWCVLRFDALSPTATQVRFTQEGFSELAAEYPEHREEFAQMRGYFVQAWEAVLGAAKEQGGGE